MMEKIRVIIKRADSKPYVTWISNTLENLQRTVGGYIETVTFWADAVIICNEEGKLLGLPYNCSILGEEFVGDLIFCGVKGDEFADIPIDLKDLKRMLPQLWEEKL